MKHIISFTIIALLVVVSGNIFSGNNTKLTVKSAIDSVLAYQDRALITRKAKIKMLSPGRYEITVPYLPVSLQNDSVRAETDNESKIKILDVEVRTYYLDKIPEKKVRSLKAKLNILKSKKKNINNALRLIEFEKEYLYSVKNHFLGSKYSYKNSQVVVKKYNVNEYKKVLAYLLSQLRDNSIKKIKISKKLDAVNKKINAINRKLRKFTGYSYSTIKKKKVKIILTSSSTIPVNLRLSYINLNIEWKPSYDIRVFYSKKKTEFIGYGMVKQRSGEDWINTKLSYSTAKPAIMGFLPELKPLYASVVGKKRQAPGKFGYTSSISDDKVKTEKKVGSLVFHVPRRTTIPSDNSPHRTTISRQSFPVRFEYLAVPRFSPHAYLRAVGKNTMDHPILQGKLNIFIENSFVGSSYADNILPGEEFELTLSVNENIRVKRSLEEMKIFNPGTFSSKRKAKFSFLIKVENFTKENIKMNVIDQIPVSKIEDIEIVDVTFSHKPVKKDKKGIIKWILNMKPGQKEHIKMEFYISFPKDKQLTFYKKQMKLNQSLQDLELNEKKMNKEIFKKQKYIPRMQRNMY